MPALAEMEVLLVSELAGSEEDWLFSESTSEEASGVREDDDSFFKPLSSAREESPEDTLPVCEDISEDMPSLTGCEATVEESSVGVSANAFNPPVTANIHTNTLAIIRLIAFILRLHIIPHSLLPVYIIYRLKETTKIVNDFP